MDSVTAAQLSVAEVRPSWRRRIALPVRVALGALILTAAGFKASQLSTVPLAANQLFTSRTFLAALVPYEVFLGLWLITGVFPRLCRYLALASFAAFAGYSLRIALLGWHSCGCFGAVTISPWTTFPIDLGALALLLLTKPGAGRRPMLHLSVFVGIIVCAVLMAALTFGPWSPFGGSRRSLWCADPHFDFGVIDGRFLAKHSFKLANNATHPVRVTHVTTSCGCTVAIAPQTAILPGQSEMLKVLSDWTAVSGSQHVEIDVRTDDRTGGRMLLDVRADVRSAQKSKQFRDSRPALLVGFRQSKDCLGDWAQRRCHMMVLSRHANESIMVGEDLLITVRSIRGNTVTVSFGSTRASRFDKLDVPPDVQLNRNERVTIAPDIHLTAVDIRGETVRLGFELPQGVSLHRKEVWDAIRREQRRKDDHDEDDDFFGAGVPR